MFLFSLGVFFIRPASAAYIPPLSCSRGPFEFKLPPRDVAIPVPFNWNKQISLAQESALDALYLANFRGTRWNFILHYENSASSVAGPAVSVSLPALQLF